MPRRKESYPSIVCKDGFKMSVQASKTHYCEPRDDIGPYRAVEVGYPSSYDHLLMEYIDSYIDRDLEPTNAVYGWVPVHVIQMIIDAHGGMVSGELPPFEFDPSLRSEFDRSIVGE